MGFIPVQLRGALSPTLQANLSSAFEFSPPSRAILFTKPHDIPDLPTDGQSFEILYLADYLKIHTDFVRLSVKMALTSKFEFTEVFYFSLCTLRALPVEDTAARCPACPVKSDFAFI